MRDLLDTLSICLILRNQIKFACSPPNVCGSISKMPFPLVTRLSFASAATHRCPQQVHHRPLHPHRRHRHRRSRCARGGGRLSSSSSSRPSRLPESPFPSDSDSPPSLRRRMRWNTICAMKGEGEKRLQYKRRNRQIGCASLSPVCSGFGATLTNMVCLLHTLLQQVRGRQPSGRGGKKREFPQA